MKKLTYSVITFLNKLISNLFENVCLLGTHTECPASSHFCKVNEVEPEESVEQEIYFYANNTFISLYYTYASIILTYIYVHPHEFFQFQHPDKTRTVEYVLLVPTSV